VKRLALGRARRRPAQVQALANWRPVSSASQLRARVAARLPAGLRSSRRKEIAGRLWRAIRRRPVQFVLAADKCLRPDPIALQSGAAPRPRDVRGLAAGARGPVDLRRHPPVAMGGEPAGAVLEGDPAEREALFGIVLGAVEAAVFSRRRPGLELTGSNPAAVALPQTCSGSTWASRQLPRGPSARM
jgi:hypothetical protein